MGWADIFNPLTYPGHLAGGLEKLGGGLERSGGQFEDVDPNGDIGRLSRGAEQFGQLGERGYAQLGMEGARLRHQLADQASGKVSLSAEQLRQGLQQNIAGQQAMAASARPGSAPMAARTAAMQAGRMGSGLAGQQATAGIQERQAAQQTLGGFLNAQRGQELNAALGGRGMGLQGYGMNEQARTSRFGAKMGQPTGTEQLLGAGIGAAGLWAASDRRLKKGIKDGADDASEFLKGLKAYRFDYKDEKHGKGTQLGIMAQDLEKSGLGRQAVIDTPGGKVVHGAKLATALAAATSTLHRRLEKLEGKK